jgi:hypothetical protein
VRLSLTLSEKEKMENYSDSPVIVDCFDAV